MFSPDRTRTQLLRLQVSSSVLRVSRAGDNDSRVHGYFKVGVAFGHSSKRRAAMGKSDLDAGLASPSLWDQTLLGGNRLTEKT